MYDNQLPNKDNWMFDRSRDNIKKSPEPFVYQGFDDPGEPSQLIEVLEVIYKGVHNKVNEDDK